MISKRCTHPGCTVIGPTARCKDHSYPDRSTHNPKYGRKAWKNTRMRKLRDQPWCEEEQKQGRLVLATEVHHKDGDDTNDADENLESLCKSCHSRHTVKEHGGFGNNASQGRPEIGKDGWPV